MGSQLRRRIALCAADGGGPAVQRRGADLRRPVQKGDRAGGQAASRLRLDRREKLMLWALVACVAEAESEVAVPIFAGAVTLMTNGTEVDAAKFASPRYCTVMECEPTARSGGRERGDAGTKRGRENFARSVEVIHCAGRRAGAGRRRNRRGDRDALAAVRCVLDADTVVVVAASAGVAGVKTKTVAEYAGKSYATELDATKTGAPATICVRFALL